MFFNITESKSTANQHDRSKYLYILIGLYLNIRIIKRPSFKTKKLTLKKKEIAKDTEVSTH